LTPVEDGEFAVRTTSISGDLQEVIASTGSPAGGNVDRSALTGCPIIGRSVLESIKLAKSDVRAGILQSKNTAALRREGRFF
jgi:hypothetical protein